MQGKAACHRTGKAQAGGSALALGSGVTAGRPAALCPAVAAPLCMLLTGSVGARLRIATPKKRAGTGGRAALQVGCARQVAACCDPPRACRSYTICLWGETLGCCWLNTMEAEASPVRRRGLPAASRPLPKGRGVSAQCSVRASAPLGPGSGGPGRGWEGGRGNGWPHLPPCGCQRDAMLLPRPLCTQREVPQKLKIEPPPDPAIPSGCISEGKKTRTQTMHAPPHLHPHCGALHSGQDVETARCPPTGDGLVYVQWNGTRPESETSPCAATWGDPRASRSGRSRQRKTHCVASHTETLGSTPTPSTNPQTRQQVRGRKRNGWAGNMGGGAEGTTGPKMNECVGDAVGGDRGDLGDTLSYRTWP